MAHTWRTGGGGATAKGGQRRGAGKNEEVKGRAVLTSVAVRCTGITGGEETGGGTIGFTAERWLRRKGGEHEVERGETKLEVKMTTAELLQQRCNRGGRTFGRCGKNDDCDDKKGRGDMGLRGEMRRRGTRCSHL